MSNASLKDQLQAVASQLSETLVKDPKPSRSERQPPTAKKVTEASKQSKNNQVQKPSAPHPKPKWLMYVQYGVELLRTYFPQTFKNGTEVKPLKKGIKQDLIKQLSMLGNIVTEDKACMVKSMAYYVNTGAYHKSVVEGAVRIDLEGNPAGVVTAEEAKYSTERYQAKLQAKQAQVKPAMVKPPLQNKAEF